MNFSFVFKSILLSFIIFIVVYSVSFISSQKNLMDNNNYGIKDSVKEAINIAEFRRTGDIVFDENTLINSILLNYLDNNNLKFDEVMFEIYTDEENDIVTVYITTLKDIMDSSSKANYVFSYTVEKR